MALRRDKRFVFRMVVCLIIGICAGLMVADRLTSAGTGSCGANMFSTFEAQPPAAGAQ